MTNDLSSTNLPSTSTEPTKAPPPPSLAIRLDGALLVSMAELTDAGVDPRLFEQWVGYVVPRSVLQDAQGAIDLGGEMAARLVGGMRDIATGTPQPKAKQKAAFAHNQDVRYVGSDPALAGVQGVAWNNYEDDQGEFPYVVKFQREGAARPEVRYLRHEEAASWITRF